MLRISVFVFLLPVFSCSGITWHVDKGPEWEVACPELATMEAVTCQNNGYPARIAVGRTPLGSAHATGQCFINGQWIDLKCDGRFVYFSRKDELKYVWRYYSPSSWTLGQRDKVRDVQW